MKQITKENCVEKEILDDAVCQYFIDVQGFFKSDFPLIKMDFKDPYECPWIRFDYIDDYDLDGKNYEVMACCTDFSRHGCMYTDKKRFRFYMLMHRPDQEDRTVAAYRNSERLYVMEPIDKRDFPKDMK